MKPAHPHILTINGGSSSIQFAVFEASDSLQRVLKGAITRIGLREARLRVEASDPADNVSREVAAPDRTVAVNTLMDWLEECGKRSALTAVGHRVVHGAPKYSEPQRITTEMLEELHRLSPFDPEHLPGEILLTEAFYRRFPDLPQVACFDTAFHHDLPRVARLLPIPLFCYQVKKWLGAFAAALGGLDTLVFAGGIGENAPAVRARICQGLGFLGVELEERRNAANEGVISDAAGKVAVRVIHTDEERMIAQTVCRVLNLGGKGEN